MNQERVNKIIERIQTVLDKNPEIFLIKREWNTQLKDCKIVCGVENANSDRRCGCALTTMYHGTPTKEEIALRGVLTETFMKDFGVSYQYASGFLFGYDADPSRDYSTTSFMTKNELEYLEGQLEGQAVQKFFNPIERR